MREPHKEGARPATIERLMSMTQREVDDLPYGFIVLDAEGDILLYNRYEARLSRMPPDWVLGKNWFREVAPCTRVEAFRGRFQAMVADPERLQDRFSFRFHFLHGAQDVEVVFTRVPEGDRLDVGPLAAARVFMTVQRSVDTAASDGPYEALQLDETRGRASGPLGPVLPLTAAALAVVLSRLDHAAAAEVGRAMGAALAEVAASSSAGGAGGAGEQRLAQAPAQLAAGALDDAFARAGLGRVAIDQSERGELGVLGCIVRPAPDLLVSGLAALYEGVLEAAVGAMIGRPLRARCLEDPSLLAQPWRFALVSPDRLSELAPRQGEGANDVARRLGLLADDIT